MLEIVSVHVSIALVTTWTVMSFGKLLKKYSSEYQPIASLQTDDNTGFNAIYRILISPVLIVLVSIVLYSFNANYYINNIWLVSVYFFVSQTLLIVLLGRWRLVNKTVFLLSHVLSVTLSYYLYTVAISKGLAYLIPNETDLRTEIWLIIAAFLYGIFRNVPENYKTFEIRRLSYIRARLKHFKYKFRFELDKYDTEMSNILLAVMIYEDFNRPLFARLLEHFSSSQTQHIMQVHGAKSDIDSIHIAENYLEVPYNDFKKRKFKEDWEKDIALQRVFSAYNPTDYSYGSQVFEVYKVIK